MSKATKVFLVVLRIAIGWHFLYEGVWKIDSEDTGQQYLTSRFFLQASMARLRDGIAGAPGTAPARIDQWNDEVVRYFKGKDAALTEEQKDKLNALCEQIKQAGELNTDWFWVHEEVLKLTADQPEKEERFTSEEYLRASAGPFRGLFRSLVPDVDGLERLTKESAQARIDKRYDEIVRHFESRGYPLTADQRAKLAAVRESLKASIAGTLADPMFQARVGDYRVLIGRLRRDASSLDAPYSRERLDAGRKKLDTIAAELTAFVNEPLAELTAQAQALATVDQMKAGPAPRPSPQTWLTDWLIKWGLTAMGLCLMLGLFTEVAAFAAAAQLAMFYLATPPFPSLPAATAGGHFLYVDRNLIEMIAALLIATAGTGRWAGLDVLLRRWVIDRLQKRVPAAEQPRVEALVS
jgi:uncharacterized membrane protein YphA (DoxX/SURF4 family)